MTHEEYIQRIRDAAVQYASTHATGLKSDRIAAIARAKLLYGRGVSGLRGVTQYGAWKNGHDDELVEICAAGEENKVQLAGTTIHELAHVATGIGHGHNKDWKEAAEALGLRKVKAAGTIYHMASFAPWLRFAIAALPEPQDGRPNMGGVDVSGQLFTLLTRPCSAGIGTRGGKSRGIGSGSRLRKFMCECGIIVRAGRDELRATCNDCGSQFHRAS